MMIIMMKKLIKDFIYQQTSKYREIPCIFNKKQQIKMLYKPEYRVFTTPSSMCSSGGGAMSITNVLSSADSMGIWTTLPYNLAEDFSWPAASYAEYFALMSPNVL